MRPEHLSLFRMPGRAAVHPDGSWAVVSIARPDTEDDSYPATLWRVRLCDGELTPFTHGWRDTQPVFTPDGQHLVFLRQAKDGKPQLAVLDLAGGEPRVLTDHPLGVSAPVPAPDSTRVAYTARVPEPGRYGTVDGVGPGAEPPRHITTFRYRLDGAGFLPDKPQHVFVLDLPSPADPVDDVPRPEQESPSGEQSGTAAGERAPGERDKPLTVPGVTTRRLTTAAADHRIPVWTPDSRHVLVLRAQEDALAPELVLHEDAAGADARVLDVAGLVPAGLAFSRDGATLWLLLSDFGPDRMDFIGRSPALYRADWQAEAARFDAATLERLTDPTTTSLAGELEIAGEDVLVGRMHRGTMEVARWREGRLSTALAGEVESSGACAVGTDGSALATASSVDTVGDLWLLPSDGAPGRVTDLSRRLRAEAGVITPVETTATSPDGYPVHGWVAVPEGDGPHPVLLLIHGGPHAQYTPTFFDEVQTYAGAGYAVVFCNPRGSAGYGQEHGRAITGAFGDRDAADVLAFLDAALTDPRLAADRVGVLGGSYGGYMTAWLTTRTDRFVAAIVERGFLDPASFVGSADIGWYFSEAYVGSDAEQVTAQSPMVHLDRVRTPTLVIHSEQDWRCPVEQGQRWYVGLKQRGVPAELLLFPGEGHELSRSGTPKHRLARFEHILRWWNRYLPVG
ncbi:S9 family peptidase [Ruania albidiflava]|uniref:S9 family peptidase n=1 Tax=Ruania albidiflava TaxID=366586 RepID=UPI0003B512D1|nr:S9 family peptidase [Ruania albidiflava]